MNADPHYGWVGLAPVLIGALVRALKSERITGPLSRIPAKARPLVALCLGQVSGILETLVVPGVSWRAALVGGLISSGVAVMSHDVFVEWLRGGRELGDEQEKSNGS